MADEKAAGRAIPASAAHVRVGLASDEAPMRQLSPLDAAFLSRETDTSPMHVCTVSLFQAAANATPLTLSTLRSVVQDRLHLLPPFRRRLIEVPFGIDHPYWVEDPEFDLDYHLHEMVLPEPGDRFQLAEQVARIVARPLDRSRPLWELHLIGGLAGSQTALVTKYHHSVVDGAAVEEVMAILLDPAPRSRVLWGARSLPGL